ncbi:MAG: hypothetical protein ACI9VS_000098 [Candidatus Binatia bacterium]|jgi:hypothetical protein
MSPSKLLILGLVALWAGVAQADNSLTDAEKKDGWILLFNGKDFSGWKIDLWNPKSITVEDGAIKCQGEPSMVYYDGDAKAKNAKNFHFIADVMTKPGANGGIFFHTKYQDKGWPGGHEAQINMTQYDPIKTGSVYIVKNHLEAPAKDNEWFRYEIIVRGKSVETKVNGKTVVRYEEEADRGGKRKLSSGTFGIQAHDPGSVVLVKNIRMKPLAD